MRLHRSESCWLALVLSLFGPLASCGGDGRDCREAAVGSSEEALAQRSELRERADRWALGLVTVKEALASLSDQDANTRAQAAEILGDAGVANEDVLRGLVGALTDENGWVREVSARALDKLEVRDKETLAALAAALDDVDDRVAQAAFSALANIGQPAIPGLAKALSHPNEDCRLMAAEVLGDLGPDSVAVLPDLIRVLDDRSVLVRATAAATLGSVGHRAAPAIPRLKRLLDEDEDELVLCYALDAILEIGVEAEILLPSLIRLVQSMDLGVRKAAIQALGVLGARAEPSIPLMISGLRDPDPGVRRAAARALGQIGVKDGEAIAALGETLADEDGYVACSAAESLWRLGQTGAAETQLLRALEDPDLGIQLFAAEIAAETGAVGDKAIGRLKFLVNRHVGMLRLQAVKALWKLSKSAALVTPILTEMMKLGDEASARAACALIEIDPLSEVAVQGLSEASRDDDWATRIDACVALGKVGGDAASAALPPLVESLEDSDWRVRRASATAIGKIGHPAESAEPHLRRLLDDESASVREAAADSLTRIRRVTEED